MWVRRKVHIKLTSRLAVLLENMKNSLNSFIARSFGLLYRTAPLSLPSSSLFLIVTRLLIVNAVCFMR
jgi:hypothetical protein